MKDKWWVCSSKSFRFAGSCSGLFSVLWYAASSGAVGVGFLHAENVSVNMSQHILAFFFFFSFLLLRFHPWSCWRWQGLTLVLLSCSLIDASLVRRRLKKPGDVCFTLQEMDSFWRNVMSHQEVEDLSHSRPLGSASRFLKKKKQSCDLRMWLVFVYWLVVKSSRLEEAFCVFSSPSPSRFHFFFLKMELISLIRTLQWVFKKLLQTFALGRSQSIYASCDTKLISVAWISSVKIMQVMQCAIVPFCSEMAVFKSTRICVKKKPWCRHPWPALGCCSSMQSEKLIFLWWRCPLLICFVTLVLLFKCETDFSTSDLELFMHFLPFVSELCLRHRTITRSASTMRYL